MPWSLAPCVFLLPIGVGKILASLSGSGATATKAIGRYLLRSSRPTRRLRSWGGGSLSRKDAIALSGRQSEILGGLKNVRDLDTEVFRRRIERLTNADLIWQSRTTVEFERNQSTKVGTVPNFVPTLVQN